MMNVEVLDEQLLNFCWLSRSLSLVDLIHVFGLFFELNLLDIEVISEPKCLGKDPWNITRIRDEKQRIKVGIPV